jgi:sugar phosphate isomerase/epimerase
MGDDSRVAKIEIAINTGSLSFDTPAAVSQAKGLGFAALEVNLQQAELRYDFNRQPDLDFYDTLAQEIELRGMHVVSVHNLFLTGAQVFSQDARREILQLAVRSTARLGASVLVVHPADLFVSEETLTSYLSGDRKGRRKLPVIAGFEKVRAEMADLGIMLALENVNHWRDTLLTNQAEHMQVLTDALECKVVFDVRRGLDRPSLEHWVDLVGERVAVCHLHDQVGGEEHHPPLAPEWGRRVPLLKRTAAQACVIEASATPMAHGNIRASRDYIARLWSEA